MPRVAIDTSVLIEYIDQEAEFHEEANAVFSAILDGKLEAILTYPTLSETYYVSARIYQKLGVAKFQSLSAELVEWLIRLPSVTATGGSKELAIEAGDAKLKYCLSLTDCYVLAASRVYGCNALFRRPEEEMHQKIKSLKKEYHLVFLSDHK